MQQDRILTQVDKMVAAGRLTDDEAARLRAAEGSGAFDAVVAEIRLRHARAHMDAAVADGEMTRQEADGYATLIGHGEHPQGLRARLAGRRRTRTTEN
jgi:polyhydroxyalkanoate synthesis regulator phasin